MRKVLVTLLLLSSLFVIVQVQAYKRTSVTAASQITVTSTDAAALQLIAGTGPGNAAGTAYYSASSLNLDFTKGKTAGVQYAFATPPAGRPANKYRFRQLFQVRNTKGVPKCVWVSVPGGGVVGLEGIYLRATSDTGTGTRVANSGGGRTPSCVSIPAGATYNVDFWWEISAGPEGSPFNVRVEAQ